MSKSRNEFSLYKNGYCISHTAWRKIGGAVGRIPFVKKGLEKIGKFLSTAIGKYLPGKIAGEIWNYISCQNDEKSTTICDALPKWFDDFLNWVLSVDPVSLQF